MIRQCFAWLAAIAVLGILSPEGAAQVRRIDVDLARAGSPLDRAFNFSVGADYPGTLIVIAVIEPVGRAGRN